MGAQRPTAIDVAVGARIRAVRAGLGQSQNDLARAIGVTFQQVQKYEKGLNRVSASTLYAIARHLEVSVAELMGEARSAFTPEAEIDGGLDVRHVLRDWMRLDNRRRRLATRLLAELASPAGAPSRE
jgi:transcriptional regulator with XRE-family HTH domain